MDNQQLFDNAWQHFIVGDGQPATEGHLCRYRTEDGRKCAIGISIPDEQYVHDDIEYEHVWLVIRKVPALAGSDVNFAHDLQGCHDQPATRGLYGDEFKEQMRGYMVDLAARCGLRVPA